MRIRQIAVGPNPSVQVQFPLPWENPPTGPVIVIGGNGSGKSLLVSALLAAFSAGDECSRRCQDLKSGGVDWIHADLECDGKITRLILDTASAELSYESEPPLGAPSGNHNPPHTHEEGEPNTDERPTDCHPGELFPKIHLILAGKAALGDLAPIQEAVARIICAPIEKELNGWIDREKKLSGNEDAPGSLSHARTELDASKAELKRVERLWQEFESEQTRKHEIEEELLRTQRELDVRAAESMELERICALAERAGRLETWIEEIEQQGRSVVSLREQHASLQSRLDALEEQFRGAPENLPELLEEYAVHTKREHELSESLSNIRRDYQSARNHLTVLQEEWDHLTPPDDDREEIARLRQEIVSADEELADLLRGRIELIRLREGSRQKLQQDFAQFIELEPTARRALDELLSTDVAALSTSSLAADESRRVERVDRIAEIRRIMSEKFVGYDRLPARTTDMLRELFEWRQHVQTRTSELEGLLKRHAALQKKTGSARAVFPALLIGGAAFAAMTAVASWDIGLFSGLVCSGISLLVSRQARRKVTSDMDSVRAAETMIQGKINDMTARIAEIEEMLGPLTELKSLDGALARFADFQKHRSELESLLADERDDGENIAEDNSRRVEEITRNLPPALSDTPLPVIQKFYAAFTEQEQQVQRLDEQWNEYVDGGSRAAEIRRREDSVSNLKHRVADLEAASDHRRQDYAARRAELSAQIAGLKEQIENESDVKRIENELANVRGSSERLDSEAHGLLKHAEHGVLLSEWRERDSLRGKLRRIRDDLSAHQTYDELRARETLLKEEAAEVRQKLTARDPLYMLQGNAVHYVAKYHAQLQSVRDDTQTHEDNIGQLREEAESIDLDSRKRTLDQERNLDDLRGELSTWQNRVEEIERDLTTTRELISSIHSELDETASSAASALTTNMSAKVRELSGGKLNAVDITDGEWFVETDLGAKRRVETLSDGTQDMLWLATRIGILETIREQDHDPVVWDEALWRLDEENLENMRAALNRQSESRQIILLTRQAPLGAWGMVVSLSPAPQWASTETHS